ncbi:MAG TPA: hypothetical protein VKA68_11565 [bacterium]|nr:hypothetical protein [bacterium]
MKRFNVLLGMVAIVLGLVFVPVYAQESGDQPDQPATVQHGPNFIDEDGDGFNDNAPDHDGDGIPNGMDEDYEAIGRGARNAGQGFVDADGDGINDNAGGMRGAQQRFGNRMQNFVDADGDGVNDNAMSRNRINRGNAAMHGGQGGYGVKDGTGAHPRPQDGTGYGPGAGTENCDGTGPQGGARRGGPRAQPTPQN